MKTKLINLSGIITAVALAAACHDPDVESPMDYSNITYYETFEGPLPFSTAHNFEVGDWDYSLQYVTNPRYKGIRCARFEIREDQPLVVGGKRSEVVIVKGSENQIGKDTWYSFAVYFPSDGFQKDYERDVISQWYKSGSPVRLLVKKDSLVLEMGEEKGQKEDYRIGYISRNRWHELIFHFVHSHESDGLIEVWHNGMQRLKRLGGNMYNDTLPKWKVGIYKVAFEMGTSSVTNRVVFFDNILIGNSNASFQQMQPRKP